MAQKREVISSKEAIANLMKYSQSHHQLLQKFDLNFYISYFDRYTIQQLQERMGRTPQTLLQFVREMACFILHVPEETLFLVMSLVELFGKVARQVGTEGRITVKDFTGYICEGISGQQGEGVVCSKEIPEEAARADPGRVRDIDLHPALVVERCERECTKISRTIKKKEKKVDSSKPLHLFEVNRTRREVITLGRLGSHISIFNLQMRKVKDIKPACSRLYEHSATIMSMAFSEKQQRVGCIITHTGLAFWDYEDNFNTEKLIRRVLGERIYYLPLLDEWVTTTSNAIHFWDLKLESVKRRHEEVNATALHDIEEITHLRCLAVSYTMRDEYKWLYIYRNDGLKSGSKVRLSHVGAQKIHYHRNTQTVLMLGSKTLSVYEIDALSLDPTLLKQLSGHQTVITSVADLQDGLVVTGDDRGNLRIWDLNSLRCQQFFKVANTVTSLRCFQQKLLFADSRLNILQLQQLAPKMPIDEQFGVRQFYRWEGSSAEIFVFTKVSCRVYCLLTGRALRVVELCHSQEEIITVEHLGEDFLVSTSRAMLLCYSPDFRLRWKLNCHGYRGEEVWHMRADQRNRLFATVGKEGNLHVWSEKSVQEGPRKSILNLQRGTGYEVVVFDLSEKYSLMVSGQKTPNVKIWQYQSCKLCHAIELQAAPCALRIGRQQPLLAIGCGNDKIYLYRIGRRDNTFSVDFLQYAHLRYPELSMNSLMSLEGTAHHIPQKRQQSKITPLQEMTFHIKGSQSLLAVCYGRGNVIAFNTAELIYRYFKDNVYLKPSVNVHRPVKETLEKQITKNQYKRTERIDEEALGRYDKLRASWNRKVHADCITSIEVCQDRYFSTLSLDGYLKFILLQTGELVASLSIRQPLPILWKLEISQQQKLARRVHEALTLISEIMRDRTAKEYDLEQLNVQSFMKRICERGGVGGCRAKRRSVRLLRDEMGQQDLPQRLGQESLKSMQAFRRVAIIKEAGVSKQEESGELLVQKRSISSQKDDMLNLLSPYHFSNRCSYRADQEELRLDQIIGRSAHVSPYNSLQKLEKSNAGREGAVHRKSVVRGKEAVRSFSQSVRQLYLDGLPVINHEKEDRYNKKVLAELEKKQPLKAISNFLKNLNEKLPKNNQIKKHLKKHSNLIPKF